MKVYNDISELPLRVFDKIQQSGNISYLIEGYKGEELSETQTIELLAAWDGIERQLFDEFGIDDDAIVRMRLTIDYIKHMQKYYIHGDAMSKTFADVAERRLRENGGEGDATPNSLIKTVVRLSKSLEMRLDYNDMTVIEFYYYLDLAKEVSKAHSESINKSRNR